MRSPRGPAQRVRALLVLVLPLAAACQVLPPARRVDTSFGPVRADTQASARVVGDMLEELHPRVVAWLPGSRARDVEVWVQESPALYRLWSSSYSEADGFWAESPGRIHLRESADSLRRTLIHELVHASLGPSWKTLPGTLEEGLCDLASAELCPENAARMRAGRLSSAAFVTGGFYLELEVGVPGRVHPLGIGVQFGARLRLDGEKREKVDPLGVFETHAGLSSSSMPPGRKKGYYGLAFLVLERIAQRGGVAHLHELCAQAREQGLDRVPTEALLAAADLDRHPETWSVAITQAIGPKELVELVRMHPEFLVDAMTQLLRPCLGPDLDRAEFDALEARLRVPGSPASLDLLSIDEVREGLWANLDPGRPAANLAAEPPDSAVLAGRTPAQSASLRAP